MNLKENRNSNPNFRQIQCQDFRQSLLPINRSGDISRTTDERMKNLPGKQVDASQQAQRAMTFVLAVDAQYLRHLLLKLASRCSR